MQHLFFNMDASIEDVVQIVGGALGIKSEFLERDSANVLLSKGLGAEIAYEDENGH